MSLVQWERGKPHFKSDLVPVKVERHNRKKDREKALEEAYERVNVRDGNKCRVTGAHLSASAVDPRARREHHHLVPRSRSKSLRASARNLILVSALAHDLITKGWIVVEGLNGDKPLFFHWSALAKSKPLVIKRHNKIAEAE